MEKIWFFFTKHLYQCLMQTYLATLPLQSHNITTILNCSQIWVFQTVTEMWNKMWNKILNMAFWKVPGIILTHSIQDRVFAWDMKGCGFDPWPWHTKSCKNMVSVAPLLTLGINTFSAETAFMLTQTGWIQASHRVSRQLAWDPTCLLLSLSFPHQKQAEFNCF